MTDENNTLSRRRMLQVTGGSLLALGTSTAGCVQQNASGATSSFTIIKDPFFIVDKNGDPLGDGFRPNTPRDEILFDPLAEGPPFKEIVELGVEQYSGSEVESGGETYTPELDSELFLPGLLDSRRLVTKPPEGYDPENPDETGNWPACTWNDYRTVGGTTNLTLVDENGTEVSDASNAAGTRFDVELEDAVSNGLYTFWVVKVVDGSVAGFHPLGDNEGGENILRVNGDGDGSLSVVNEGGSVNATPGFAPVPDNQSIPADVVNADNQYWLAGAYHYDDQTWGFYPGPNHMVHFRFEFEPDTGSGTETTDSAGTAAE